MKINKKYLFVALGMLVILFAVCCKPKEYSEYKPVYTLANAPGDSSAILVDKSTYFYDVDNHPNEQGFRVYINGKLVAGHPYAPGISSVYGGIYFFPDNLRGKEIELTLAAWLTDDNFDETAPPDPKLVKYKGKFTVPAGSKYILSVIDNPDKSKGAPPFILFEDKEVPTPPSLATFKMRVNNSSQSVSVIYADGTPVQGLTSIPNNTITEYVEIPYGTYLFRVVDGKQNFLSSLPLPSYNDDHGTQYPDLGSNYKYFLIQPYVPGGIYTINVSTDNSYTINQYKGFLQPASFGKIGVINAAPDLGIDGITLDGSKQLTDAGPLSNIVEAGDHKINISSSGKTILTIGSTVRYLDNTIIYITEDKDGKPDYAKVSYFMPPYDEIYGFFADYFVATDQNPINRANLVRVRFLNLSADAGDVSFLSDLSVSGQPYQSLIDPTLASNISYKEIVNDTISTDPNGKNIYVAYGAGSPSGYPHVPVKILAYNSTANPNFPGAAIVGAVLDNPFIDPKFPQAGIQPGIYTVALIGSSKKGTLKLAVYKHTN